jgi:hypothetical protein
VSGAQDVIWTGLTNVAASGGSVMHNGGGYFAMARSQQTLSGPGYFEWTFDGEGCVAGLGNSGDEAASANYFDLDFAFQLYPQGYGIRELGAYRGEGPVAVGDIFRVEIAANGDVLYKRNGQTVHVTSNPIKVFPYYLVFKTQEVAGNSISGALAGSSNPGPTPTPTATPTVSAILPTSGPTSGGTSITISGSGFLSGATVSLGGAPASNVTVVNGGSITATTSARVAGAVNVVVTNTNGQAGTLAQGFSYVEPQAPVPAFDRVFIVVEENQSFANVIGSPSMPYLNALADRYGLAVNYFANTQPSIGNYFWLTTGQVITNDSNFTGTVTAENIVRQLNGAGKTWKSYAESLPSSILT